MLVAAEFDPHDADEAARAWALASANEAWQSLVVRGTARHDDAEVRYELDYTRHGPDYRSLHAWAGRRRSDHPLLLRHLPRLADPDAETPSVAEYERLVRALIAEACFVRAHIAVRYPAPS